MLRPQIHGFSCVFALEPPALSVNQSRRIFNMDEKFELICMELLEETAGQCGTFGELCARMKADETRMNNLFYMNFGVSGEEVFYKFLIDTIVIAV